ncbi:MAG: DEAD/DEAH box helicase family protein, partial [Bacteroidetes bacterium]|nr:DEAD/DEAH box helicase family protein [Bacteroidota bacterium]
EVEVHEGVAQAKEYAAKLKLDHSYAANGKEIYHINMETAMEGLVSDFHSPEVLWSKTFPVKDAWKNEFSTTPYETKGGTMGGRFYQELAVEKVMDAIAEKKNRILLTLATGTGKTFLAFQIAWKLFHTRWNLQYDGKRRPRILFLADRNILADQAYNAFSAFPEDALVRITPKEIQKKGSVPTNGNLFFTIFQTFMSGTDKEGNPVPYFGEYPQDYFDLIFIDECHRGGANDESNWRDIMTYFSPAIQVGLTATPKRQENADTYKYFGNPVYIYSLKEGIEDGYLTPFKVRKITTSLDEYTYQPDDTVVEGEIEVGKTYKEAEFNRSIEIDEREAKRVKIFMDLIDQNEKTLVFCANQAHAAFIRDLINQYKTSKDPNYCVRVTANDGELGEQYLREFQDNEKTIPTILTTSQKLSTGVDARNIRNIVLLRPVNSMIEFKQIIGRGTRLFDDKNFFTIYDFVNASERFKDPEWDGEPEEPVEHESRPSKDGPKGVKEPQPPYPEPEPNVKIKVTLANGKEREILHSVATTFIGPDGRVMTVQEFLNSLYGKLPSLFSNEAELRKLWSDPRTRKALLDKLEEAGFGSDELKSLQKAIDAEKCDLFDVLEFISYAFEPITREHRVAAAHGAIIKGLEPQQKEFIEFVLSRYIETGVEELYQEKLPDLLQLKYNSVSDAAQRLGGVEKIRETFIAFQKNLYANYAGFHYETVMK